MKASIGKLSWFVLSVIVGVVAFFAGLATELAQGQGCTWAQRNFGWIYLIFAALIVGAFYFVHRAPAFNQDLVVWRTQNLMFLVLIPWVIGFFLIAPTLFGAIDRGRQKLTIARMRNIATALGEYHDQHKSYPSTISNGALVILPISSQKMELRDGWNSRLLYESTGDSYILVSHSRCGRAEQIDPWEIEPCATLGFDADIVVRDGTFVRFPEGIRVK